MALRPIPPKLRDQLDALATAKAGILKRFLLGTRTVALVEKIGRSAVPLAIPNLIPFALQGPGPVRDAARSAIDALAATIKPIDLPAFDLWMRTSMALFHSTWWSLPPGDVTELAAGEHTLALLGMCSTHRSGYVREIAVKELIRSRDGGELGWLLMRGSDWVKPVQELAVGAVMERVRLKYAGELVHWLPLILQLQERTRAGNTPIAAAVLRLLASADSEPALGEGLRSPDRHVSRACFRVLIEIDETRVAPLLQIALESQDFSTRLHAVERRLRRAPGARLPELCALFADDPVVSIRRMALQVLTERAPAHAEPLLHRALLDRHGLIRQFAQFHLRDRAGFESRNYYLEQIGAAPLPDRAVALCGLGETGQPGDLRVVRLFLGAPETSLRKAALQAAARLAPSEVIPELLSALEDDRPGVSRLAARILTPHVPTLPRDALEPMLLPERRAHIRRNALRLVFRAAKWDQLPPALRLCADNDSKIVDLARCGVVRWLARYNRSYLTPEQGQLKNAEEALARGGNKLDAMVQSELKALLADWRRP